MFRSYSIIIVIVCVTRSVFAFSKLCGENEIMSPCANRRCDHIKCSDIGGPKECLLEDPKHCRKGCVCIKEYLRDDNGKCIPSSQCPNYLRCPNENEFYDECPPFCPSRTCAVNMSTSNSTITCPINAPIEIGDPRCPPPACRCKAGFYRDSNKNCVPWDLCQPCRENEKPTLCIQDPCERRDCSDLLKPITCMKIDPNFCKYGCLCQDGFLKNSNGTCVPVNQCPEAKCSENEEFDLCPPACPSDRCNADSNSVFCLPNPKPGDPSCQPSCRCLSGFRRNSKGRCIPQTECPTRCGINEVYDECIASCPPRRCDTEETLIDCAPQPQPGDPRCVAGCRCADNFFRNNLNVCVSRSECREWHMFENIYPNNYPFFVPPVPNYTKDKPSSLFVPPVQK